MAMRTILGVGLALMAGLLAGCPSVNPTEYIVGGTGKRANIGTKASVKVFSPSSDLPITGGTPLEVTWEAVATSNFASINVIFDPDTDPNNGNEIVAQTGLALSESSVTLDTTSLPAGSYNVGVVLIQANAIVAVGYAPGKLIVNQRTNFIFSSPRDNYSFDRTDATTPRFDVTWTLSDPDSTVTVRIYLSPVAENEDAAAILNPQPSGSDILLRESTSQTGDSFSFNLPTNSFPAGKYRILAQVSDGLSDSFFYAPASIRLRARFAGLIDLRNLGVEGSGIDGVVFEGVNPRDNGGSIVTTLGDIDRDGFSDFMIVSQFAKPFYTFDLERAGVGETYLVYGRAKRFTGNISLNSVGALFRGEIFTAPPEARDPVRPTRGITACTKLSDWDGDGVPEIAFGAPFTDSLPITGFPVSGGLVFASAPLDESGYFRTGGVIIVAGSALLPEQGFPGASATNIHNLAAIGTIPHEPITPNPCPEGFYGPKSPSSPIAGPYTYFHRHTNDYVVADITYLGCRLSSNDFNDQCGESISAYEYNSIIVSIPNGDPGNMTRFGDPSPGAGVVVTWYNHSDSGFYPWSNVGAPPANATLNYPGTNQSSGFNLIPHGGPYHYILSDGRPFPFSGDPQSGFQVTFPGAPGFIVSNDSSPCTLGTDARVPNFATTLRIYGTAPGGRVGNAVAIDDFNRDGIRDFLVGNPLARDGAGACYVIMGRFRDLVTGGEISLDELDYSMNGSDPNYTRIFDTLRVVGNPGDRLGQSQDQAGDFNGDGFPDVLIGSPLLSDGRGGVAVLFGTRDATNLTQSEIPFSDLPNRGLGVIFLGTNPQDEAGIRVASAGDVDGDGLDDILIAAPGASVRADVDGDGVLDVDRTNCGVVYLIYGSSKLQGTYNLSDIGTEKLPGAMFVGRNSGDQIGGTIGLQGDVAHGIGRAGDVDGDGSVDLLISSISASPRDRTAAGETYLIYGPPH